jgi:hypothetical protein
VKELVTISTTSDGVADPTQTIVATISGDGFSVSGPDHASVNVLDDSPTISIKTDKPVALESDPVNNPGEFVVSRTGNTTNPQVVDFTTATGGSYGTLGTNYTLADADGNNLTNSVTIPAGQSSVAIIVTPIDDHLNDGTLTASLTLVPDSLTEPTYHVADGSTGNVKILNDDRFTTIANTAVSQSTARNTPITWTFDQLVTLTGASLAGGSDGTLALVVGKRFSGDLKVLRDGSLTPVSAPAGTVIHEGDSLIWSPPSGVHGTVVTAFDLLALDGTLDSLSASLFSMTIGA